MSGKRLLLRAAAPYETEGLIAAELRELGLEGVRAENGSAYFEGTYEDAFRACLWSRTADRVLICVGAFPARSFDELFDGAAALPWEDYIPRDAAVPVSAKCARSQLMSVPDCQSITKKAIVARLCGSKDGRLSETGARYAVTVHLHGDIAGFTIDCCGAGLTRRGYRTWNGQAPLRESMAALLLRLSPWYTDQPLCDPMCGSGTIAIEGAMMALDRAPGLRRGFDMEGWEQLSPAAVRAMRAEAEERFRAAPRCEVFASDMDEKAVAITRRHISQAGLDGHIHLTRCDFRAVRRLPDRGAFVLNPPYGMRLLTEAQAGELYRALGAWKAGYPYWSLTAISACRSFERFYGAKADKKRRLMNGNVECGAFMYRGQRRLNPQRSEQPAPEGI